MSQEIQSTIQTLGEVLNAMAPFAGGSVPDEGDQEYTDWVRWVGQKQEEYARRAMWRRCLTREEITLTVGFTTLLPRRFHKVNGLYMLVVTDENGNETDLNDPANDEGQVIFIEMINDPDDANFGRWQMRFRNEIETAVTAVMWYFSNPPKPVDTEDILLLPGDMVAYGSLQEYFRTTGAEGSEDKMEELAEGRFIEYLGQEVIPAKSELIKSTNTVRIDRLARARNYYRSRRGRGNQY